MKNQNAVVTTLALAISIPALAQPSPVGQGASMIEEITVTARKRSESLLDIPMTVSAFSAEDIEKAGYTTITELIDAVPGVTYGSYQAEGQGDSPSFRGVSNNTGDPTRQNSSKFIDGVYVSGSLYTILLADIERVEVVKGPQSALYGRATFSGAVNYITKRPTDEVTGSISATVAEYDELRVNGTISGPIIKDKLAGRLTAGMQKEGSPYDNITNGDEMGDNELATLSTSLLFTPSDALSANLYMSYAEADLGEAPRGTTPLNFGELEFPLDSVIGGDVDQLDDPGIDSETTRINLTIDYDFNDYTLTSVTGYGKEEVRNEADGNYAPGTIPLFFLCNAGPFQGPGCDIFQTVIDQELESTFQEFRITSPGDARVRWLAGVSYFDEDFFRERSRNFAQAPTLKNSENLSIFGSVSFDISDKVTVSLDGRYQEEDISLTDQLSGSVQEDTFNSFLPRAIIEYSPSQNAMFYASVAKGNKPGDFNATGPVEFAVIDEEELWNYEIGTKFSTADGRYSVQAAAYFIDWTNQRFRFTDPNPTVGSYDINAGETEIYGIDISAVARLTPTLTASLAYAHVSSEFQIFESQTAVPVIGTSDVSGNETPRTPANSLFASLQHQAPLTAMGGDYDWFARADVSYRDKQYIDEINLEYLEEQTLVNFRVGVEAGRTRVTLWLENAFDNEAPTTGFRFGQLALVGLPLGRQLGLTAAYSF